MKKILSIINKAKLYLVLSFFILINTNIFAEDSNTSSEITNNTNIETSNEESSNNSDKQNSDSTKVEKQIEDNNFTDNTDDNLDDTTSIINDNSIEDTNVLAIDDSIKTKEHKDKIFSIGLYGSVDTIKTSVNLEFGFRIVKFRNFEIRSYTSVVWYQLLGGFPDLYMLGMSEKFSFGQARKKTDGIEIIRYGFAFFSFGALGFNADGSSKELFTSPVFYEVGGGAGFHIYVTHYVGIVLEFGGGLNAIIGENNYQENIAHAAFGKISVGSRYHF